MYLINRTPSKLLHNKTPYEMLFNKPPPFEHLRCFGCLCFVSTLPHHRHKFASRALKCVFLGYPHGIKGYKVLDLDSNSIHISRDIVFYENIYPFAQASSSLPLTLKSFDFPHSSSDNGLFCSSSSSYVPLNSLANISIPLASSLQPVLDNSTPLQPVLDDFTPLSPILDPIPSIDSSPSGSSNIVLAPTSSPSFCPRRSSRPQNPPAYLTNYSCKAVVSKPAPGLPYNISDHLSYENLGNTFYSFVMPTTATPAEPTFFHQAVKSVEWRAAMDKEIAGLEQNNT